MGWIVKDWANNTLDFYGESETFEDAWDKILCHNDDQNDDACFDEFYVEEQQ